MRDDELYVRLNRAAASVEKVVGDARPIVDDLKVFAQKIADDPRQLGVKGALDRRPAGVGFNFNSSFKRPKVEVDEEAVWIQE
jgi:phospholipid/cholesterol/gamma-HCH transport system substrate-binding protein